MQQVPTGSNGWTRLQLPESVGMCYLDRFAVDTGLELVQSRYQPVKDLVEESTNLGGPRTLVITMGLQGESGYRAQDGSSLGFRGGHTTVSSFESSSGERQYQAGSSVAQLRLVVREAALSRYVGEARSHGLLRAPSVQQLAFRKTSAATSTYVHSVMRQMEACAADPLAIHIHALSLLSEQLKTLQGLQPRAPDIVRLKWSDVEKLERMRDLMHAQMSQPLTIDYLCVAVGLSESKLKLGCRNLFNVSPHRMLLEIRMRRAWALLEAGNQVAQAGWQVGYAHPSNFSAAFTRFFGRTPKSVFGG